MDDGGLIFGDSGEKGLVSGNKEEEEVPVVQERKEEIPVLAPVVPIQSEVNSIHDTPTPSQDTSTIPQPSVTSDKRQKKRGPNKPKPRDPASTDQSIPPSTERKKTQAPKPKGPSTLPPKPQDDGFEQVVRKQATRGRGAARGGGVRGRGRGRGGATNGASVNGAGK